MFFLLFLSIIILKTINCSGFQKDLNVNIPFPPLLDRRDGVSTGHLRPLGWQNRAEGPVNEESVILQPNEFWDKYISKNKPIVVRGLVLGSDAVDRWTDMYLNKYYGYLDIKITQRKQTLKSIVENKTQMSLKDFLQGYRIEDWYLRGIMPKKMQDEAPVPRLLNCGPFTNSFNLNNNEFQLAKLIEPYLWLSAGETSSLIHSHHEHNLHCVLDGRKDFILIPNDQFLSKTATNNKKWHEMLDLIETYPNSGEWYSKIDVDLVNAYKNKILHNIIWYWASLRAGDCIYLPSDYLHQVRSYGRSISSSIYFNILNTNIFEKNQVDSIKNELFSYCLTNSPLFEPMSSLSSHFTWTYTHSERHLNKKDIKINDSRNYLIYMIRNDNKLYYENFDYFYKEITKELKNEMDLLKPNVIDYIRLNASDYWNDFRNELNSKQNFLTIDEILSLNSSLNRFIILLNLVANYHDSEDNYKIKKDEL